VDPFLTIFREFINSLQLWSYFHLFQATTWDFISFFEGLISFKNFKFCSFDSNIHEIVQGSEKKYFSLKLSSHCKGKKLSLEYLKPNQKEETFRSGKRPGTILINWCSWLVFCLVFSLLFSQLRTKYCTLHSKC